MDSNSVAVCSDSAELDQGPLGSGSGVSRTLVRQARGQTITKPGWPEHQNGLFLGCHNSGLLTGVTDYKGGPRPCFNSSLLMVLSVLHGPLQSIAVFKTLFSRALLPPTCSLPDAQGHGVGRETVAALAHPELHPEEPAYEPANCSWDKGTF